MQGTIRIDLGCNQFAAERQYWRRAVRGGACRTALIGADEISADQRDEALILKSLAFGCSYGADLASSKIKATSPARCCRSGGVSNFAHGGSRNPALGGGLATCSHNAVCNCSENAFRLNARQYGGL